VLAAMLQDRQRVVDPLVDRAGSDNTYNPAHAVAPSSVESVLCGRAARVPQPLLANQRAQSVRHGFAVGDQQGPGPPPLAIETQQLAQDDEYAEQYHSAQKAENQSEETVHAAEDRQPHEVIQQRPDSRTE